MNDKPFTEEISINEITDKTTASVIEALTTATICDPAREVRIEARKSLRKWLGGRDPKIFIYNNGIYLTLSESRPFQKAAYVGNVPETYINQKTELHLDEDITR